MTKIQVIAVLSNALSRNPVNRDMAFREMERFNDSKDIPKWAVQSVANVIDNDILVNYPNPSKIEPSKNATRAEVAAMLYNLRQNLKLNNETTSTGSNTTTTTQEVKPYYDEIDVSSANGAFSEVLVNGIEATVLEDTTVPTELKTPLSSVNNKVGDKIILRVMQDMKTRNGLSLILRGSRIEGKITELIPAKDNQKSAKITINFDTLVTPYGYKYPISASVATQTGNIISGSLQSMGQQGLGASAKEIATQAILGSLLGSLSGDAKKGAIYGGTSSTGLGKLGSILYSGGEIEIPASETIFIKFTDSVTFDTKTQKVISR